MNYVSVVYFITAAIVVAWWFIRARSAYTITNIGI